MADRGETLVARKKGGGRPPNFDQTTKGLLEEDVKERPGPTVYERSRFVETMRGKSLSVSTLKEGVEEDGFHSKTGVWGHWPVARCCGP